MYEEKTHSVKNRIVSISQPYLRPIVRSKAKNSVEFGAKFDLSIDEHGYGRIEKLSFEAYNESTILQDSIERYKERTGHYPKRVLVDQIYRTRDNRSYCKLRSIRLSGPKLGRPSKDNEYDKKIEYQDNVDRIEVERLFSLSKRCYNLGLIKTKLKETTMTSIALSIFVTNLFKILLRFFVCFVCNLVYYRKYPLVIAVRWKMTLVQQTLISTGESLRAVEELVKKAGGEIIVKVAILAEGDAADRKDIMFLEKLPLFPIQ
jgi:hypothetical protein